jgi:hypothetical protein
MGHLRHLAAAFLASLKSISPFGFGSRLAERSTAMSPRFGPSAAPGRDSQDHSEIPFSPSLPRGPSFHEATARPRSSGLMPRPHVRPPGHDQPCTCPASGCPPLLTPVPEASFTDRAQQRPMTLPPDGSDAPGRGIPSQSACSCLPAPAPASTSGLAPVVRPCAWPVAPLRVFPDYLPHLPSLTRLFQGRGLTRATPEEAQRSPWEMPSPPSASSRVGCTRGSTPGGDQDRWCQPESH